MMDQSYWNETGKHQEFLNKALDQAPSFGYTNNIYMNMLICMGKVYYDAYNNDGCNIEDSHLKDFNRYVAPYISGIDIQDFTEVREGKMERAMDKVLSFLQDKPLDYTPYSVWWSYSDKVLSRVEPTAPTGKNWSRITFGMTEAMDRWCSEQESFCLVKDVTKEIKILNESAHRQNAAQQNELPELCFSTLASSGELIVLNNGMSGYFQSSWSTPNKEENQATAKRLNNLLGVSSAQIKAMEFGSLFGWDKPGADPSLYEKRSLQDKIAGAQSRAATEQQNGRAKTAPALQL